MLTAGHEQASIREKLRMDACFYDIGNFKGIPYIIKILRGGHLVLRISISLILEVLDINKNGKYFYKTFVL